MQLTTMPAWSVFLLIADHADTGELLVNDLSPRYAARITLQCGTDADSLAPCPAVIRLYAQTGELVQTFNTAEMIVATGDEAGKISVNNEDGPLIAGDFNFDGQENLAIRNGSNSGYATPSFDICLYSRTRKQFVRDQELTGLASTNPGMFTVDRRKKRLQVASKSGCGWCFHEEYAFIPNRGLPLVYTRVVDDASAPGYTLVAVEEKVGGKWKKSRRRYKEGGYREDD